MIALQNLLPMLVDADNAFILALEAHLRTHKNRTSPAPEAVSIGGPFSAEEIAETQAKLEELQAMPGRIAELEKDIAELEGALNTANAAIDAAGKKDEGNGQG